MKIKELIKKEIIKNADETKYRYELGKKVIDATVDDIINVFKHQIELIINQAYENIQFGNETQFIHASEIKQILDGDI